MITDNIGSNLSKLAEKVLYDCRLEVEENRKNINLENDDYDIEMCG